MNPQKGENWEKTTVLIPGFHSWCFLAGLTAELARGQECAPS